MSHTSKVSKQELMPVCPSQSQIKKYRPVLPTVEKFQCFFFVSLFLRQVATIDRFLDPDTGLHTPPTLFLFLLLLSE